MSTGKLLEIEGTIFKNWKVVSYAFSKHNKRLFNCICIGCNTNRIMIGTRLIQGKIGICFTCTGRKGGLLKNSLIDGFEKFVIKNTEGCWGWKGCAPVNPGYGQFRHGMKLERAHRASWIIHFGEIPKGMHICHTCDNRICSNPQHLFMGTAHDNLKDMFDKKRHHNSKLTDDQVREIRQMLLLKKTGVEISKIYNVTPYTISNIKLNKTRRLA